MNPNPFTISELMDQIMAVTTSDNITLLISDLDYGTMHINTNEDDGSTLRYTINVMKFRTMNLSEIRQAVQNMTFEGVSLRSDEIVFYMRGDMASAVIQYKEKGDEA